MTETFRPRSNLVWAGCSIILIILFVANSFWVVDNANQNALEIVISLLLFAIVYFVWIKPKLILRENLIEVVNPFKTELIEYRDVLNLETKWILTIIHVQGRTRVWVAPTSGKQRWIADKKFGWYGSGLPFSETRMTGMESMSESLDSISGQAAHLIRERIKRTH